MKPLLLFPIGILAGVAFRLWQGVVLSKLWLWFAVPQFGVAPLGILNAAGIGLAVSFLTYQHDSSKEHDQSEAGKRLFNATAFSFIYAAIILLAGWLLKSLA